MSERDEYWRRYAAGGYRKVEGCLEDVAVREIVSLAGVQRQLGIRGPVCEIGVHYGRSFILLHLLTQPGEISVAIDLYEQQRSGQKRQPQLLLNLRRHHGDPERVRIISEDSLKLTPERIVAACEGQPRFFSIDGSRCAENVCHDLVLAQQTLCDGGLVCVTDYFSERWPGVSEGVCRFMGQHDDLRPVAIGGNKFFMTRSTHLAQTYRDALALDFGSQARLTTVFGQSVLVVPALTLRQRLGRTRLWKAMRDTPVGDALRNARWLR